VAWLAERYPVVQEVKQIKTDEAAASNNLW
jgi:hypothetical protein